MRLCRCAQCVQPVPRCRQLAQLPDGCGRNAAAGDVLQRCRLSVNEEMPFACPEGCLFFEPRKISDTGWLRLERPEGDDPA